MRQPGPDETRPVSGEGGSAHALLAEAYGDWRAAVRWTPVPVPSPGPDEVLIATEAAALNFPDMLMVEGKYQVKPEPPFIPGRDVAGRVLAVGAEVTDFVPGDAVVAQPPFGAFSTHALAPSAFCFKVPEEMPAAVAAASGTVLATVVGAIGLRARPEPGERVMITGAAGGVGSVAIQYARLFGAEVAAVVSSAEKEALVRDLGVAVVVRTDGIGDLKQGLRPALQAAGWDGVHAVVDMVGGDTFDGALRCLHPAGRMVVVGFASGRVPQVATNYLLLKDLVLMGSSLDRLLRGRNPRFRSLMAEALQAAADDRIRVSIDATFPMPDFAAAMERIASRQVMGKVVLVPPA